MDMDINQREMTKILSNLSTLELKLQKRILTGAIKAGAKTVQNKAKSNAPKDTENLEESIVLKKSTQREKRLQGYNKNDIVYMVGIDFKKAFYANVVEFGSKYSMAQPFMTPAYEQTSEQVLTDAKKYIKKRITKIFN